MCSSDLDQDARRGNRGGAIGFHDALIVLVTELSGHYLTQRLRRNSIRLRERVTDVCRKAKRLVKSQSGLHQGAGQYSTKERNLGVFKWVVDVCLQ